MGLQIPIDGKLRWARRYVGRVGLFVEPREGRPGSGLAVSRWGRGWCGQGVMWVG